MGLYSNEDLRILYLNNFINAPAGGASRIELSSGGSGYSSTIITISDPNGSGAVVVPYVVGGVVSGAFISNHGSGYTSPTLNISGGGGSGAAGTVILSENDTILNDTAAENEVVDQFLVPYNFNGVFLYDLNNIAWSGSNSSVGTTMAPGKQALANFCLKLQSHSINNVGFVRKGTANHVNQVRDYTLARANPLERPNYFVFEWEFWNSGDFNNFLNALSYATAQLNPLGIRIVLYLGWFDQSQANQMMGYNPLFLLHDYRTAPQYGYIDTRLHYLANAAAQYSPTGEFDWAPIFSAEALDNPWNSANDFMGHWYETNTLNDSFNDIRTNFDSDTHTNTVQTSRLVGQVVFDWSLLRESLGLIGSGPGVSGDPNFVDPEGPLTLCVVNSGITLTADYQIQYTNWDPVLEVPTSAGWMYEEIVSYDWYKNLLYVGSGPTLLATGPGDYLAIVNVNIHEDDGLGGENITPDSLISNTVTIGLSTFNPTPPEIYVPSATGSNCFHDTVILSLVDNNLPPGAVGVQWSDGSTITPGLTYTANQSGTFTAYWVGADGCLIPSDPVTLLVSDKVPVAEPLSGGGQTCSGSGVNGVLLLPNSNADADYHLYLDGVDTGIYQTGTGGTLHFTLTASGTYTVQAVMTDPDFSACAGVWMLNSVDWIINPTPATPTVTPGSGAVCFPEELTSTVAPNGGNYEWNNGNPNRTITITTPGTYKVRVQDGLTGCWSDWSADVVITGRSPGQYSITQTSLYTGACGALTPISFYLQSTPGSDTPDSISWYKDGVLLTDGGGISGATTSALSITQCQPGGYWAVLHFDSGDCDITVQPVSVIQPPYTPYSPILTEPWVVCPTGILTIDLLNPDPNFLVDLDLLTAISSIGLPLTTGNTHYEFLYADLVALYGVGTTSIPVSVINTQYNCNTVVFNIDLVLMTGVAPVISADQTIIYQGTIPPYATVTSDQSIGTWNTGLVNTDTLIVTQSGEYWFTDPCGNESNHVIIIFIPINPVPEEDPVYEEEPLQVKKPTLVFRRDNPYSNGYIIPYKDLRLETFHRFPISYRVDQSDNYHQVTEFDDIWTISYKYYGNSKFYWVILEVNEIENAFELPIAEYLLIPNLNKLDLQ